MVNSLFVLDSEKQGLFIYPVEENQDVEKVLYEEGHNDANCQWMVSPRKTFYVNRDKFKLKYTKLR